MKTCSTMSSQKEIYTQRVNGVAARPESSEHLPLPAMLRRPAGFPPASRLSPGTCHIAARALLFTPCHSMPGAACLRPEDILCLHALVPTSCLFQVELLSAAGRQGRLRRGKVLPYVGGMDGTMPATGKD